MVWFFEMYQRNVRDWMRMEFGLWSVVAKGYDVTYWMWSRRERGPCLDVARVLGTREGDRRVDVCCDRLQRDIPHGWRKCDRGSELFVTCILVQRHEATNQEGAKKYHFCLNIPINSLCAHVAPLLFVSTRCVVCFLVGAQSIVQRFDSFLCPC